MTVAEEKTLFREAMADVMPLDRGKRIATPRLKKRRIDKSEDPDMEAIKALKTLIETGRGFVVSHTAEYVEGASTWMPPEVFRRLHSGHFSIQAHVDLHGMNVDAARTAFDRFMKCAVSSGKRAVLVVHGRGRSSPCPPVLKRHLFDWLTRSPWKRWVLAFTSARPCDGGTGTTYVLLRHSRRSGKK